MTGILITILMVWSFVKSILCFYVSISEYIYYIGENINKHMYLHIGVQVYPVICCTH